MNKHKKVNQSNSVVKKTRKIVNPWNRQKDWIPTMQPVNIRALQYHLKNNEIFLNSLPLIRRGIEKALQEIEPDVIVEIKLLLRDKRQYNN